MSQIIIAGDTSGTVALQAPAVAGTTVLTLPTTTGTVVTNNTLSNSLVASYPPSTAGNIIATTDGTTWSSVSKLTTGTPINASALSNVLFTGIPSWVKRITLVGNDVVQSLAGDYAVQIGSGSLQTSGYLSFSGSYGNNASGSTSSTASFNIRDIALTNTFIMTITRMYDNTYASTHHVIGTSSSVTSGTGNGKVTLSGALDRINISITGGATLTGTFNIVYE